MRRTCLEFLINIGKTELRGCEGGVYVSDGEPREVLRGEDNQIRIFETTPAAVQDD